MGWRKMWKQGEDITDILRGESQVSLWEGERHQAWLEACWSCLLPCSNHAPIGCGPAKALGFLSIVQKVWNGATNCWDACFWFLLWLHSVDLSAYFNIRSASASSSNTATVFSVSTDRCLTCFIKSGSILAPNIFLLSMTIAYQKTFGWKRKIVWQ